MRSREKRAGGGGAEGNERAGERASPAGSSTSTVNPFRATQSKEVSWKHSYQPNPAPPLPLCGGKLRSPGDTADLETLPSGETDGRGPRAEGWAPRTVSETPVGGRKRRLRGPTAPGERLCSHLGPFLAKVKQVHTGLPEMWKELWEGLGGKKRRKGFLPARQGKATSLAGRRVQGGQGERAGGSHLPAGGAPETLTGGDHLQWSFKIPAPTCPVIRHHSLRGTTPEIPPKDKTLPQARQHFCAPTRRQRCRGPLPFDKWEGVPPAPAAAAGPCLSPSAELGLSPGLFGSPPTAGDSGASGVRGAGRG